MQLNKKTILIIILSTIFGVSNAQLANRSNLTFKDVQDRVNGLLTSKDPLAKDSIKWESNYLIESNNEEYIKHGKSIFNFLGDSKSVEIAHQNLLKKFPKSTYVAGYNLDVILGNYIDEWSLDKEVNTWRKKYRTAMQNTSFSDASYAKIAKKLLSNGAVEKAKVYGASIVSEEPKANFEFQLAKFAFDQDDLLECGQLLDMLIVKYASVLQKRDYFQREVYTLQAQLLSREQQWSAALNLIESYNLGLEDIKFQALMQTGRNFDAFLLLDSRYARTALSLVQEREGSLLFQNLGSTTEQWEAYKNRIDQKKKKDNEAYWKNSIINEESIDFSLLDMQGNRVKSSDYKGKILILDFWATWCGPCVNSFPGMQAAVDKYKDDAEVVFLFINTWERGEDFKSKVESFIADKGYRFHVIYDEEEGEGALVEKYGITGIPTKIIIDQNGRVRFKSSGSSSVVKEVVDEISYKVDLIKNKSN